MRHGEDDGGRVPWRWRAAWGAAVALVLLVGCERVEPRDPGRKILLSEVDYDQPERDVAEYIELYNTSAESCDLGQLALVLINGTSYLSGMSHTEYARIPLAPAGALAGHTYLAVGRQTPRSTEPGVRYAPRGWRDWDNLQNGPNDGVLLVNVKRNEILDALIYESVQEEINVPRLSVARDAIIAVRRADSMTSPGSFSRELREGALSRWHFTSKPTPGAPNLFIQAPAEAPLPARRGAEHESR